MLRYAIQLIGPTTESLRNLCICVWKVTLRKLGLQEISVMQDTSNLLFHAFTFQMSVKYLSHQFCYVLNYEPRYCFYFTSFHGICLKYREKQQKAHNALENNRASCCASFYKIWKTTSLKKVK